MFKRTRISHAALAALGSGLVLAAAPAAAQTTPPPPGQTLERVEITGSAIRRIDAETAVPVTVIQVDELKRQGVTTVEQALQFITAAQTQVSGSRSVGSNFGGAVFADLRGIGSNKTLVLLNGRRVANNAVFDSQVDINLIPIDAVERIDVLREGASALYGTDAVGGVINFITKKNFRGGTVTVGVDVPKETGGSGYNFDIGYGLGDLSTDRFNVFGTFGYQRQKSISGLDRPFQTRFPAGLSPTTFPANYFQGGNTGNPAASQPGGCGATTGLIPGVPNADGTVTSCQQATSAFVDHVPETEKYAGFLKGEFKVTNDLTANFEYFGAHSQSITRIAPVPYGGLRQNRTRPDGSLNPYYPGNPGSSVPTPNIPLDPNFTSPSPAFPGSAGPAAGLLPGYVNVRFRDFATGNRAGFTANNQNRVLAGLEGTMAGWDFNGALNYNQNRVRDFIRGYSNGNIITAGVRDGVINPFGAQSAAGAALIASAGVGGLLVESKGTVYGADFKMSREVGDWLGAGRPAALALGVEGRREDFLSAANTPFASTVVASTGIDPESRSEGSRNVYAGFAELNIPLLRNLEVTAAVRHDRYSDFGSSTNPKFSFRYEATNQLVLRGSASTGFRAPSLYELNASQAYTNTATFSDPTLCPGGVAAPGVPPSQACNVQFQELQGGNKNLKPEESKQFNVGIVLQPVRDLSVTLDYFWIKVDGSIGAVPAATIIADPTTFAQYYFRNPQGFLSTDGSSCPNPATCGYLDARNQNLGNVKTTGLDLQSDYRMTTGFGNLNLHGGVTYLIDYEYQDFANGPYNKNVGRYVGVGPIFRWQGNAALAWDQGPWGAGVAARYKSGYADYDPSNKVSSYTLVDVFGSWSPLPNLRLTLGVRNLFDRDPPFSNQQETFQGNYDPRFTDPVGRTYYARGTLKF
jgi:iron complex outermembrane receptor protein